MSTIVVSQFITLDGVFEDPGGSEGHKHGLAESKPVGPDGVVILTYGPARGTPNRPPARAVA